MKKVQMTPGIFKGMKPVIQSRRATRVWRPDRDLAREVQFRHLGAALPPDHTELLYPANSLFTARLPDCDFSPRGTPWEARFRGVVPPPPPRSLILSSNVGGVRRGIIVNPRFVKGGLETLKGMPALKSLDGIPLQLTRQ